MVGKRKWTSIRVPVEIRDRIKAKAEKDNVAMWQIVIKAIECIERNEKKAFNKQEVSDLDRVSYYIMKFSYSISKLKDEPTKENLTKLAEVVTQIKTRVGVDVSYVLKVAEKYVKKQDKENTIELNMAWKMAIRDLISSLSS